jgi:hypothetical protein
MIGVSCRLHDMTGDDIGIAHLPSPIECGDLVATERGEYRIDTVIRTPPGQIDALVRVQPMHLPVVAAS